MHSSLERAERLVAFIYLLARDHVTFGQLTQILKYLDAIEDDVIFTNKHVEGFARDLLSRLEKIQNGVDAH